MIGLGRLARGRRGQVFPLVAIMMTGLIGVTPPRYYIVGWAAFVITSYRLNGCGNKSDFINGYFVHQVIRGMTDGTATADYRVRVVTLVG
jgi:hypothetical protein